jgi:hypothetical protein
MDSITENAANLDPTINEKLHLDTWQKLLRSIEKEMKM